MPTVSQAVEALVRAMVDLPDAEMDRPWVWREYDEEGLRFALLMAQHELRDLAVRLAAMRPAPPSQAQRILGQYHHAYRDLTGALAGVRDADLDRVPKEGEWPLRDVIEHVLGAEYGFLSVIQYELAPDRPRDPKQAEERVGAWRDEHGYRAPKRSKEASPTFATRCSRSIVACSATSTGCRTKPSSATRRSGTATSPSGSGCTGSRRT